MVWFAGQKLCIGGENMKKDYLEVILEDINSKFDLVLEGYQVLSNDIQQTRTELKSDIELCNFKIDTVVTELKKTNAKIDAVAADLKETDKRLSDKIDGVASDLKAHRQDTEAHGGMYCVKEG